MTAGRWLNGSRRRTGNGTKARERRIAGLFGPRDNSFTARAPGVDTIELARHPLRDSFSHRHPLRRPRGFPKAGARAARRSLREKDLAWTEYQTIHQRNKCEASRVASRTGPPQHLGRDAPCGVLEVRRAAKNRRREARFFRAEGQQFLYQARTRQLE